MCVCLLFGLMLLGSKYSINLDLSLFVVSNIQFLKFFNDLYSESAIFYYETSLN